MAETKLITSLYVVTDSETSYDNIGDIDGGLFPDGFLEKQTYASQQTVVDNALKLVNDKIKTTWPDTYIDYYTAFNDSTKI